MILVQVTLLFFVAGPIVFTHGAVVGDGAVAGDEVVVGDVVVGEALPPIPCKEVPNFELGVWMESYKCDQPYGGDPPDLGDVSYPVCSCEEPQLCLATKKSTLVSDVDEDSTTTVAAELDDVQVETLEEANTYVFKCLPQQTSFLVQQQHLSLGQSADTNNAGEENEEK